jgi:hypothetical protein
VTFFYDNNKGKNFLITLFSSFFFVLSILLFLLIMSLNKKDGIDIPKEEGINNFDDTPYFDYHHLKAIENVSFFYFIRVQQKGLSIIKA